MSASWAALEKGNRSPISVDVEWAEGEKCERCWKYPLGVGGDETFPTVCSACGEDLREILGR